MSHGHIGFDPRQRGPAAGGSDAADRRAASTSTTSSSRACCTSRSCDRRSPTPTWHRSTSSDAASMPGVVAVYHAAATTSGSPALQGFPMMPPALNRPDLRHATRCASSATSIAAVVAEIAGAGRSTPPRRWSSTIDPLPAVDDAPPTGSRPTRRCCSPSTARTSASPPSSARRAATPLVEGADAVAEVTMVSQRLAGRADGEQRRRRRARPTAASRCGCRTRRRTRSTARTRRCSASSPVKLRVVCPWVGGGFGPKAASYVEHLIAGEAALTLGRPVKWVETRSEDMVSLVHGRDYVMTARLGVDNDGKIVGLDVRGRRRRRRLPGDRRHPADADADDVGRRVRDPEGAVRRPRRC